jgi:hypothetical protein
VAFNRAWQDWDDEVSENWTAAGDICSKPSIVYWRFVVFPGGSPPLLPRFLAEHGRGSYRGWLMSGCSGACRVEK